MKSKLLMTAGILILSLVIFSVPSYAGKKEATKQLDVLNEKVKEAGKKGDLQAAIDAADQALALALKEFGEKSIETVKALNNVGNLYMYANHAEDAERLYKKAILIETDLHGREDLGVADSLFNLAMSYAVQKKFEEAGKTMNRVYKIRIEKLGESHPETKKAREALDNLWKERTT